MCYLAVMERTTVRLGSAGRFVIPARYRRLLGVEEGDELVVRFEDGELRIVSRELAVARAKALVKKVAPADGTLSGRFVSERRRGGTDDLT